MLQNLQSECKGVAHMFNIIFRSLHGPFDTAELTLTFFSYSIHVCDIGEIKN